MQFVLTGSIVLALVAFFARPALALVRGGARVAAPPIVAVDSKLDPAIKQSELKLDGVVSGAIKLDLSSGKLGSKLAEAKWKASSLKCDDVTVVATDAGRIVASAKATQVAGDPASCVYSMKVPAEVSLSIYAEIGSAHSIGLVSLDKVGLKSDLIALKLAPAGTLKTESQAFKLKAGSTVDTLPIYLKLDS
jgi:hypothetical protein